jgi:hypothetical protein
MKEAQNRSRASWKQSDDVKSAAAIAQLHRNRFARVSNKPITLDWRIDARAALVELHVVLAASDTVTEIPPYVVAMLREHTPKRIARRATVHDVRSIVHGAFRAITDVSDPDEHDPIIRQIWKLNDTLPDHE